MVIPPHLVGLPLFDSPNEALATSGREQRRVVAQYEFGVVEIHALNRSFSRSDEPAVTIYREDGTVSSARWFLHGEKHREGGLPSRIECDLAGVPTEGGEWFFRGKNHRIGGPAVYWPGVSVGWWVRGAWFPTREAAFTAIAEGGVPMIRDALVGTEFAELLDTDLDLTTIFTWIEAGVRTVSGVYEVLGGSPVEWVAAFEGGQSLGWVTA